MASPTYVIGHRNPDADAICSAIAYAALKLARGEEGCVAARCGNSNDRIDAILQRFEHPLPLLLPDVTPRLRDVMTTDILSIAPEGTCAEALDLLDQRDLRMLPVVRADGTIEGTVSVFQLGKVFMPHLREPRRMRRVLARLSAIARSLSAVVHHMVDGDRIEELFVRVAAMDIDSFGRLTAAEDIPSGKNVMIVGDRLNIQRKSISNGVRLLVISGNQPVLPEIAELARAAGVSLMVSPWDSATTAWIIRAATAIETVVDKNYSAFNPDLPVTEARRKVASSSSAAFLVTGEDGKLAGLFSKTDLFRKSRMNLILVDHNETSQAVAGADEVSILEIIDHHRLGPTATQQPILFINEPVGSTCTIVADLFRRDGIDPSPGLAGIMMSGIVSDTLLLQSPTATPKDRSTLEWLAARAGVDARSLAQLIFSSGSVILGRDPRAVIESDYKLYEEDGLRFGVSQIEELGFANYRAHSRSLGDALEQVRAGSELFFCCLLVTDINTQNSLLLVRGDRDFIARISYPRAEGDDAYDMPGIVSRKKQLVPYLTGIVRTLRAEGAGRGP
jgi:manganese-dependent inorganic pyrophosphatase